MQISVENVRSGRIHTLITSAFSHVEIGHIVSNMIGLYFFGMNVWLSSFELLLGHDFYFILVTFLLCLYVGVLCKIFCYDCLLLSPFLAYSNIVVVYILLFSIVFISFWGSYGNLIYFNNQI